MHPLQRTKVVIASTLKPVDDVRLYEKIARALTNSGRYECHMIGAQGHIKGDVSAFQFRNAGRLSLSRVIRPVQIAQLIFQLKPDVLIVATHELLFAATLYQLVTKKVVVYDVQENYFLNILHTNVFPAPLRWPLAAWVRMKEKLLSRFVSKFLLAEKGYLNELGFVQRDAVVLENKAIVPPGFTRRPEAGVLELLFSGTIDESTGIHEAIALIKLLHARDPRFRLHIIGYCARASVLRDLREETKTLAYIRITGGETQVPHSEIMKAIARAHFGLICYRPSPHINNRMPTKLFEYMACRLPILIRRDLWWCDLVVKTGAGLRVDFNNPDSDMTSADQKTFYPGGSRNLSFEFDKTSLVEAIDQLVTAQ